MSCDINVLLKLERPVPSNDDVHNMLWDLLDQYIQDHSNSTWNRMRALARIDYLLGGKGKTLRVCDLKEYEVSMIISRYLD